MKQMTQRQIQASELFKRKLAEFWVKDDSLITKELRLLTFTQVKLTPDFGTALIFYMQHFTDDKKIQEELEKISKTLRYELAHRMNMKKIPVLKFAKDDSLDYAEKIESLFNSEKVKKDLGK